MYFVIFFFFYLSTILSLLCLMQFLFAVKAVFHTQKLHSSPLCFQDTSGIQTELLFVCLAFCQILAQVSSLTRRVLVFLRIVCILPSAVSRRQAFLSLSVDLQGGACGCRFVG